MSGEIEIMACFLKILRSVAELIESHLPADDDSNSGDDLIDDLYDLCGPGEGEGGVGGGDVSAHVDGEVTMLDSSKHTLLSRDEEEEDNDNDESAITDESSDIVDIDLNDRNVAGSDILKNPKSSIHNGKKKANATKTIRSNASGMLCDKKINKDIKKILAFSWKYSRICIAKLINAILFKSVMKKLSAHLAIVAENPFVALCGLIVVYLLFLVIYFLILFTSFVVYPLGSLILFILLLNFLVRTVAGMISFVGSSTDLQHGLSKDYLKRFVATYLAHCDQLSAFSMSVFKYLSMTLFAHRSRSIDSNSMTQISQYALT